MLSSTVAAHADNQARKQHPKEEDKITIAYTGIQDTLKLYSYGSCTYGGSASNRTISSAYMLDWPKIHPFGFVDLQIDHIQQNIAL